jgi:hypothetical protein
VSGDQDTARGEVKASVPLVVRGVPKEHTMSRAGHQLVRSGGGGVRVTHTRRPEGGRSEEGNRRECGVEWEQEKQWTEDG